MVTPRRFTLTQYLIEQRRRFPGASGDFNALLLDVALACKAIARSVAFGEPSAPARGCCLARRCNLGFLAHVQERPQGLRRPRP